MPLKNKARTCILVSLFYFALHANGAQGQWHEIVHVDLEAEDAVAAKEQATAQAEKDATEKFFSRVAPDVLKSPEKLDDISSRCYAGMDILSEKTSGVRYIAKIQQNFNRSCVLGFLEKHSIQIKSQPSDDVSSPAEAVNPNEIYKTSQDLDSPSLSPSKPLLLIAQVLLDEKSINFWADNAELPSLVVQKLNSQNDYLVPLGDLNDQIILPPIEFEPINHETFQKILGYYEATQGVLALIKRKPDGNLNPLAAIESFKISPQSLKRCPVKDVPTEGLDASMDQLATFIAKAVSQSVQACTIGDILQHVAPPTEPIRVTVALSGFANWLKIKKELISLSTVSKISIHEMASDHVGIDIHLNSTFEDFEKNLHYMGLIISEISGQNMYEIRSGAATE